MLAQNYNEKCSKLLHSNLNRSRQAHDLALITAQDLKWELKWITSHRSNWRAYTDKGRARDQRSSFQYIRRFLKGLNATANLQNIILMSPLKKIQVSSWIIDWNLIIGFYWILVREFKFFFFVVWVCDAFAWIPSILINNSFLLISENIFFIKKS